MRLRPTALDLGATSERRPGRRISAWPATIAPPRLRTVAPYRPRCRPGSAPRRGEVLVVGVGPPTAPLPTDRRERVNEVATPGGHAGADVRPVHECRARGRAHIAALHVGILDRVDVDRVAERVRRPARRMGPRDGATVE